MYCLCFKVEDLIQEILNIYIYKQILSGIFDFKQYNQLYESECERETTTKKKKKKKKRKRKRKWKRTTKTKTYYTPVQHSLDEDKKVATIRGGKRKKEKRR